VSSGAKKSEAFSVWILLHYKERSGQLSKATITYFLAEATVLNWGMCAFKNRLLSYHLLPLISECRRVAGQS